MLYSSCTYPVPGCVPSSTCHKNPTSHTPGNLHVPLITPYHATLHALDHRDAKGNAERRRQIWERLQKATRGFHVQGERKGDGRTVWMVERDPRGPNAESEHDGQTALPATVAEQPQKITKVSPGKGPGQK